VLGQHKAVYIFAYQTKTYQAMGSRCEHGPHLKVSVLRYPCPVLGACFFKHHDDVALQGREVSRRGLSGCYESIIDMAIVSPATRI